MCLFQWQSRNLQWLRQATVLIPYSDTRRRLHPRLWQCLYPIYHGECVAFLSQVRTWEENLKHWIFRLSYIRVRRVFLLCFDDFVYSHFICMISHFSQTPQPPFLPSQIPGYLFFSYYCCDIYTWVPPAELFSIAYMLLLLHVYIGTNG